MSFEYRFDVVRPAVWARHRHQHEKMIILHAEVEIELLSSVEASDIRTPTSFSSHIRLSFEALSNDSRPAVVRFDSEIAPALFNHDAAISTVASV
ncbi:hypothetical protein [Rhodopseudomonas palustris]|uniref:Uncharacterized protein n=1 Tax=Rhodopseudomonas palustris (strain ATCC BAA-98 / CGA009) TaxID=258594 RepID=A0AAF0BSK5_RHOPA|nr:hypothetical protein [Rhodopseudomonas palustris]WAB77168.1 hypothetical protein OR798_22175 [Rhodopseudomonas palustris]WCL94469.1 hypothetical protein TX73_022170 [Rhodopseudomonas palustris CGA009]WND51080.1 hypothetical protein L1A21_22095 [Rhodopseudomonas palustris]